MAFALEQYIDYSDYQETVIPEIFTGYHKNQVHNIISGKIYDQAISRKNVHGISIDGLDSKDLDDAIWVEKMKNGYRLSVHIADVAELIHAYTPLDLEALKRATSIYLPDRVIPMIPSELSNGLFSLDTNGDDTKLTMTVEIDLDEEGNEVGVDFFESRFTNLHRHDYDTFRRDFQDPDYEHNDAIHTLNELSQKLFSKRVKNGAIVDFHGKPEDKHKATDPSLRFNLSGNLSKYQLERLPHNIVEECMIQANVSVGNILSSSKEYMGLFRGHDAIDERAYYHHDKDVFHFGLAVRNYLHFTSPIRRYPDLICHRELKNLIQEGNRVEKKGPVYSRRSTSFIGTHCNNVALKNALIGGDLQFQNKGVKLLEKLQEDGNHDPETYELKIYIRNGCNQKRRLAAPVRRAIIKKIQVGALGDWAWLAGVVLLGADDEIKNAVRNKVLHDTESLSMTSFIHILEHTQILQGTEKIFSFEEEASKDSYSITCYFKGGKIASGKADQDGTETFSYVQSRGKRRLVEKIFDHFMNKKSSMRAHRVIV